MNKEYYLKQLKESEENSLKTTTVRLTWEQIISLKYFADLTGHSFTRLVRAGVDKQIKACVEKYGEPK